MQSLAEARELPGRRAPAAVRTDGLVRRYGDVTAVDGIDLEISEGEIFGFLGPNGAGKTTLLRMLCTLLRPSEGHAWVAGHDVVSHPQEVRKSIGVALQDAALDDRQTGRELLKLQGRLYGLSRQEIQARLSDVLDLVDIGDAIDRFVGTYSGGMKRRLDLAAALVHNPQVLFLDEPTTGLDPASREHVWREVRRLNDELKMTIFLTTQYLEEADLLAERVAIISEGRIVAEGSPDSLKRSVGRDLIVVDFEGEGARALDELRGLGIDSVSTDGHEMSISTVDGAAALSPIAIALNRSGLDVKSLTLRTPTLDDVFKKLTGSNLEGARR
jgi:ABC-2 type transport system ATP-binding protein